MSIFRKHHDEEDKKVREKALRDLDLVEKAYELHDSQKTFLRKIWKAAEDIGDNKIKNKILKMDYMGFGGIIQIEIEIRRK